MSAFGGKADVNHCVGECPLLAISGHTATRIRSPKSSKIGCTENPLESVQITLASIAHAQDITGYARIIDDDTIEP